MCTYDTIQKNYNSILKIVDGKNVRIVAVTKYYDENAIINAYRAGLRDFGESRALESVEKINKLDDEMRQKSTYHFIGHLQTNKVKHVVGFFDYIHSVDSLKVAKEIAKCAAEKGIVQKILIQVNVADEKSKFGIAPLQTDDLIKEISKLNSLKIEGLMNIAPLIDDEKELRKYFSQMRKLKERYGLKELSMGMSNDFKIALEEGATIIRLGRTLFKNS